MPIARNSVPSTTVIEPIKAVANVIANQMGIPSGRMMIDYERWEVPTEGLFCVVGYLGPSETIGAADYFDAATDSEIQELSMLHHIQIDLMSIIPDNSARLRKEEVLMALRSFYAANYLTSVGIGMSWIQSDITDTSKLEVGNYLNRYTTTCSVNALHTKRQTAGSFNKFPLTLNVADQTPDQIDLAVNPLEA